MLPSFLCLLKVALKNCPCVIEQNELVGKVREENICVRSIRTRRKRWNLIFGIFFSVFLSVLF